MQIYLHNFVFFSSRMRAAGLLGVCPGECVSRVGCVSREGCVSRGVQGFVCVSRRCTPPTQRHPLDPEAHSPP